MIVSTEDAMEPCNPDENGMLLQNGSAANHVLKVANCDQYLFSCCIVDNTVRHLDQQM